MHVGDAVAANEIDVDIENVRAFTFLFFAERDESIPIFGVQQIAHLLRTAGIHSLTDDQKRRVLHVLRGVAVELLRDVEPTSQARYVAFTTLYDPVQMPGLRAGFLPWPYVEGLRLDEAMHPLTILAAGLYGRVLPNQNGAPVRLVVPWKYGFKGIKTIVKIELTREQPATTWNVAAPDEYGFYANVNPAVDHPRWSQATERRIGENGRRPTLPFNGYAEQVAGLYSGMDLRRDF